jgi:hypothetical protein
MEDKMTKEHQIDLTLAFATFRCFNEQLYLLKGSHSKVVKLKFNRLIKLARQYEDEMMKNMGDSTEDLDSVLDVMMDIINDVKLELQKNIKEEDNAK